MADLFEQMLESIDSLSPEQLEKLNLAVQARKEKQERPLKDNNTIGKKPCVHCGSLNTKKHGIKNGKQRYICKDCGKTFNQSTGAVTSGSRLTENQWREVIRDNDRLTALCTSCLHIFRHISQILLD